MKICIVVRGTPWSFSRNLGRDLGTELNDFRSHSSNVSRPWLIKLWESLLFLSWPLQQILNRKNTPSALGRPSLVVLSHSIIIPFVSFSHRSSRRISGTSRRVVSRLWSCPSSSGNWPSWGAKQFFPSLTTFFSSHHEH